MLKLPTADEGVPTIASVLHYSLCISNSNCRELPFRKYVKMPRVKKQNSTTELLSNHLFLIPLKAVAKKFYTL